MTFTTLISSLLAQLTYKNIFILMALESTLFPVPSEAVIIPAGYNVFLGNSTWYGVFIASILGGLVGSLISYFIALYIGRSAFNKLIDKYGKFLFIKKEHLTKTDKYFKNYGPITIFLGRLIPGIRHFISLPAGFARMPLGKFISYTLLGASLWTAVLLLVGYFIKSLLNVKLIALLIAVIIFIVYLVFKKKN